MEEREKRTQRIYIRVNEEEKQTLQEKAMTYGYRDISPYVRDASIHEQVVIEEIIGKSEILKELGALYKEVQLLRRDHRYNFRLSELKEDDQQLIENMQVLVDTVHKQLHLNRKKVKG